MFCAVLIDFFVKKTRLLNDGISFDESKKKIYVLKCRTPRIAHKKRCKD